LFKKQRLPVFYPGGERAFAHLLIDMSDSGFISVVRSSFTHFHKSAMSVVLL